MFKIYFCKFLEYSQAFVHNYWAKIKKNSYYQLENAENSAERLEHLQVILQKFDLTATSLKDTSICYFQKRLRLCI